MQSTFFKLVRAGLKVILAIGIGVLVFLAVCFIARRYEAEETKRLFREHRDAFSSALEIEGREISPFNATLYGRRAAHPPLVSYRENRKRMVLLSVQLSIPVLRAKKKQTG